MALFEITNLSHTYTTEDVKTPVLHDLSFSIEKGEFVSVVGHSGSGKSTLLHILGFLLDHSEGEYRFGGKKRKDFGEDELAHVRNKEMGFVFQSFNLLSRQTVAENIGLPLAYSDVDRSDWEKKIKDVVDIVGLNERMNYPTYQLSGGEKQRVAIARALVNSPKVIFADEPTGNLDTATGVNIMETLNDLNKNFGHTILLITHEETTARYADRIIQVKDGRIESDHEVDKSEKTCRETFKK